MSLKTRTDVSGIQAVTSQAVATLRAQVGDAGAAGEALATLETFLAVGLRVMASSKPERVRKCATVVELQALIPKA